MQTAKLIFTALAVLIVIPLIAANWKHYKIKKPGEPSGYNVRRIAVVSIVSVVLVIFFVALYKFTIDYQAQIVAERYCRSFDEAVTNKIDFDKFKKEVSDISTDDWKSSMDSDKQLIDEIKQQNPKFGRFQLSDEMLPEYYAGKKSFPGAKDVSEDDTDPVYVFCTHEFNSKYTVYLVRLKLEGNKWKVMLHAKATDEQTNYGISKNFIKPQSSVKWFN